MEQKQDGYRRKPSRDRKLRTLRRISDLLAEEMETLLRDPDQFRRHIITTGTAKDGKETVCETFEKADCKSIRDLTAALKDLAVMTRSVYDIPTEAERRAMALAEEKLQRLREGDGRGDGELVLRFAGADGADEEAAAEAGEDLLA